ncbi:MAG: hypothetical protein HYY64_11975 [Candidatus Rokubacteria bacterium]|nr:hypothetical protein [Candidatus Rokubacteria bacterium]
MRRTLGGLLLPLGLLILPVPAWAGFTLSLAEGSAVVVDSPSRLHFSVANTGPEGLSRLSLRFPPGYDVVGGSAPAGWTVELDPSGTGNGISFRTSDEVTCRGAVAAGRSLAFSAEVVARASRAVTPDSLASAHAEDSCRGVVLDPPGTLPAWERLGLDAVLAAGPSLLGVGGEVTVTLTVSNLSTVELADVSPLLRTRGGAAVTWTEEPAPAGPPLAPGGQRAFTWTGRPASGGTLQFTGQALSPLVASPPAASETLFVADLGVSLAGAPDEVVSGQQVVVEMTVTNRGPVRVARVSPSPLTFEGAAAVSGLIGPSPAVLAALEPGESATFAWSATVAGRAGDTYAVSGWASGEWGAIVSQIATWEGGTLTEEPPSEERVADAGGPSLVGGGAVAAADLAGAPASGVQGGSVQFVGVNQDGSQSGGTQFSAASVRDLWILVAWQSLSGTHSQRLDLYAPDGSLYQRLSAQFTGSSAEVRLPVGGTWITQHFLFGTWRVDVFLDGDPRTSGAFVLTP